MILNTSEVVYIGECDSLADRFQQHHKQDAADWGQILVATTTETTFNKAHARLAEHLLVERARRANRMGVLTRSTSRGSIDEAFTREFVENVVLLTQTLGVILFRPILDLHRQTAGAETAFSEASNLAQVRGLAKFYFSYTQEGIPAQMITDGRDFVILKGSKARADGVGIPGGD